MKLKQILFFLILSLRVINVSGQEDAGKYLTDMLKDLQGTVQEEKSIMRKVASEEHLNKLLNENPKSDFFVFTEDRLHDIRLTDAIPERWVNRTRAQRNSFKGEVAPGEYYVWQIGVYSPFKNLKNLSLKFSSLVNEAGQTISSSQINCFNLEGNDKYGKHFTKQLNVNKGCVQALWIGTDFPVKATGVYRGTVIVLAEGGFQETVTVELKMIGKPLLNHGDNEAWRKSRLRWLDLTTGNEDGLTAPYTALTVQKKTMNWLGGHIELSNTGLPSSITTCYDANNNLDKTKANPVLAKPMRLVIETSQGEEILKVGSLVFTKKTATEIAWRSRSKNTHFDVACTGKLGFDGISNIQIKVKSKQDQNVKDIRLEVPYSAYASRYMMGLGHRGGFRPDTLITWKWDVEHKHQDKIWMGNVNAGINLHFFDESFVRPLVNIYYAFGQLNLPKSWGNDNRGGIHIHPSSEGMTRMVVYSGERTMTKGEELNYNFDMQITPVKPLDFKKHIKTRFLHDRNELTTDFISRALREGANQINIHHRRDIYPFINYPYRDQDVPELKKFIDNAHQNKLGVRVYYTTRELTIKIPEIWALRSLGGEVIHDGPGKDARTLIHRNGPNEWLNKNFTYHFIPAWYNAFYEGKYAGDMDISVITTPDSRWNNYYLCGLQWMVDNLHIDGIYIDDSALDRETLRRARRILDADSKPRLIDIHSWNHMNKWAGFANSIHLYTELFPYVDQCWIGEGFTDNNSLDFWLVEMSGIPFGLMSESLNAYNQFRGMIYCMLPRLGHMDPHGTPLAFWDLFDRFGMKDASMYGYWDEESPVKSSNPDMPVTVYKNGDKALVVIANWTDMPQQTKIEIDAEKLGFQPSTYTLPEIKNIQWGGTVNQLKHCEILGRSGMVVLLEK